MNDTKELFRPLASLEAPDVWERVGVPSQHQAPTPRQHKVAALVAAVVDHSGHRRRHGRGLRTGRAQYPGNDSIKVHRSPGKNSSTTWGCRSSVVDSTSVGIAWAGTVSCIASIR